MQNVTKLYVKMNSARNREDKTKRCYEMTDDTSCDTDMDMSGSIPGDIEYTITILTEDKRLEDITSEALDSLKIFDNIFQRGGSVYRLKEKEPGKLAVENINVPILRSIMGSVTNFL